MVVTMAANTLQAENNMIRDDNVLKRAWNGSKCLVSVVFCRVHD